MRLTAFEQGYAAFLRGTEREDNPFDKSEARMSRKSWDRGWVKARGRK